MRELLLVKMGKVKFIHAILFIMSFFTDMSHKVLYKAVQIYKHSYTKQNVKTEAMKGPVKCTNT